MSIFMANALGTGIFCGIWQGVGTLIGLPTWMGFVGCTSYFAAGGGKKGFIKSICCNYVGLLWGMCIILAGNISSGILFGAIVTGFFSWLIVYQSRINLLSLVPNTFMGGFSAFASGGDWKMLCICLVVGNCLGAVCDYSGKYFAKKFGKKDEKQKQPAEDEKA